MKSTELSGKTIAELKALAKRKRIAVPANAKKTDIIRAISAAGAAKTKAAAAARTTGGAKGKTSAEAGTGAKKKAKTKAKTGAKSNARSSATVKASARGEKRPAARAALRRPASSKETLAVQDRIEDAKYFTGTEERSRSAAARLPVEYGQEDITLMARDPDTVYAYWEVPYKLLERERAKGGKKARLCVRLYDITGVRFDGTNATSVFDQEVHERIGSWYFDLRRPSHAFCADIGIRTPDGRFRTIARSNIVVTPRSGVSDIVESEWTLPEQQVLEIYGLSAGIPAGASSEELRELLRIRKGMAITSPGLFSPSRGRG